MGPSRRSFDQASTDLPAPLSLLALVSLSTTVTLELVRSTGPLLEYAFEVGIETVAGTAIATYLAPGALALAILRGTRRSDARTTLLVSVILLAATRLVLQGVTAQARFAIGLATIALSIAALTLAVSVLAARPGGGRAVGATVAFGAAAGIALQLMLGTWDAYWRHTPLGWVVTATLLGGLVAAAVLARRDPATAPTARVRRVWVLGPTLSLLTMVLANSGFAASQSGVRLAVAGPIAAVGLLAAAVAVSAAQTRQVSSPRRARPLIAVAPAVTITAIFWTSGPAVVFFLVAAQLAVVFALAATLDRGTEMAAGDSPSLASVPGAASLAGLGTIVPLLVFQFDYDIPLGFPNELVIVAAALVAGLPVVLRRATAPVDEPSAAPAVERPSIGRSVRVLLAGAAAMVLVGSAVVVGRAVANDPEAGIPATAGQLTLVSWNVHYGVSPKASVDLEQIARSIEEQRPSIVTLQEVSRGWVLGGGTDMATWLAERLEMNVVFAPAADRQFGNAILTDLPHANAEVVELPYGEGPQNRSAISVDVMVAGERVRVTSVHLQNKSDIPTRLGQIDTMLEAEGDNPTHIIAGDFNAQPDSPEINRMTGAGLVSAQDVSGDPSAMTDPSINPEKRIDWVFGRGVSFIETEVLSEALSSDHLPLTVTFSVGR